MTKPSLPGKPTASPWTRVAGAARAALVVLLPAALACSDAPSGPKTGSLSITVSGLPAGAPNAITVTGPAGSYTRTVSGTEVLEDLVPGTYTVLASVISVSSGAYAPAAMSQQVQVSASGTPATISVFYAITTGSIAVGITGLPQGTAAAINISGPGGYYRQLTEPATLAHLAPGSYEISSGSVSVADGNVYSPTPIAQVVNVFASETPRSVTAKYVLATGALEVAVTGLPAPLNADVTVSGPGGYSRTLPGSSTLTGLFPGTYAVVARNVGSSPTYAPTPTSQNVDIGASLTPARASVAYAEAALPPPPQFNLSIDGMYVTQAVQKFDGSVPLIAGMPGLVRVFVKASTPNSVGTTVRLRIYQGSTLSQTLTLLPNTPGVPTTISEGTISSSWNALMPASLMQPGLRILADVDPGNALSEADESDNTFPVNGTPFEPRVELTTPLNVTVVPVAQQATGLTGNVTLGNLDEFLVFSRKVLPIPDYRVTLHPTFSTAAPGVESNNGNSGWFQILGEINTLRVAEGTSDYYLGVVGTPYNSGVAGFAFAPGKTAITWDKLPSASPVTAHELAHNLGRLHAPCGGAGSPDASYPYVFGTIGVYGYDIETGALKFPSTSDLMGYCGYGWISDYTYTGILNYRLSTAGAAQSAGVSATSGAAGESFVQAKSARQTLVVWGRIEGGRLVLEPAFTAHTRPVLPARPGPYRIEGRTADGRVAFSWAFEGERPADVRDPSARLFAFAIPLDDSVALSIARISLTSSSGLRAERVVRNAGAGATFDATIDAPGSVQFRLSDPNVPLAVVRDRASQRIIAFVRNGRPVRARSGALDFDVQLSDGVRSTSRAVRAVRR